MSMCFSYNLSKAKSYALVLVKYCLIYVLSKLLYVITNTKLQLRLTEKFIESWAMQSLDNAFSGYETSGLLSPQLLSPHLTYLKGNCRV